MSPSNQLFEPIIPFIMACLLITLFLPACSLFDGKDSDITDPNFRENYEKWQERDLANYTFTLDRYCFCGGGPYPAKIVVEDKTVSRVVNPDSKEPVSIDSTQTYADVYPTVEDLFNLIKDAVERDADQLDVTYNEEFGYPEDIDIDYSKDVVDEEIRYDVSGFGPLGKYLLFVRPVSADPIY